MQAIVFKKSSDAKILCDAIQNKQRVNFFYHEKERIGEPQCCGITKAGKEAVRLHMIKGGSQAEQLFEVSQLKMLRVLDEVFIKPGPNYKRDNSAMKIIYCQL